MLGSSDIPTMEFPKKEMEHGIPILEFVRRIGFAKSNNEARILITQGGFTCRRNKITDPHVRIHYADGIWLTSKVTDGKIDLHIL